MASSDGEFVEETSVTIQQTLRKAERHSGLTSILIKSGGQRLKRGR